MTMPIIPELRLNDALNVNVSHFMAEQCEGVVNLISGVEKRAIKVYAFQAAVATLKDNCSYLSHYSQHGEKKEKAAAWLPVYQKIAETFEQALDQIKKNEQAAISFKWKEIEYIPRMYFFEQKVCQERIKDIRFIRVGDAEFYVLSKSSTIGLQTEEYRYNRSQPGYATTKSTFIH